MIYLSQRIQIISVGKNKNKYLRKGQVFETKFEIESKFVKKVETNVPEDKLRDPKVLAGIPHKGKILIQAETSVYGIVAFYMITVNGDDYSLAPIVVDDAKIFFNSCAESDRKQQRFPTLLTAEGQNANPLLADQNDIAADDQAQKIQAGESREKLRHDCVHSFDQRTRWANHPNLYIGLHENNFDKHGCLK